MLKASVENEEESVNKATNKRETASKGNIYAKMR